MYTVAVLTLFERIIYIIYFVCLHNTCAWPGQVWIYDRNWRQPPCYATDSVYTVENTLPTTLCGVRPDDVNGGGGHSITLSPIPPPAMTVMQYNKHRSRAARSPYIRHGSLSSLSLGHDDSLIPTLWCGRVRSSHRIKLIIWPAKSPYGTAVVTRFETSKMVKKIKVNRII